MELCPTCVLVSSWPQSPTCSLIRSSAPVFCGSSMLLLVTSQKAVKEQERTQDTGTGSSETSGFDAVFSVLAQAECCSSHQNPVHPFFACH